MQFEEIILNSSKYILWGSFAYIHELNIDIEQAVLKYIFGSDYLKKLPKS